MPTPRSTPRGTQLRRLAAGALVAPIVAGGLVTTAHRRARAAATPFDCGGEVSAVVVDTRSHRLALCERRVARASFDVRLGHGGVGKRREGDGKTPIGRYALGAPRASTAFGTFIPIDYPTEAQRRDGFTGSAVGVHGPHRALRFLGPLATAIDSTDGCVGLASDDELAAIAAWIHRASALEIVLR